MELVIVSKAGLTCVYNRGELCLHYEQILHTVRQCPYPIKKGGSFLCCNERSVCVNPLFLFL